MYLTFLCHYFAEPTDSQDTINILDNKSEESIEEFENDNNVVEKKVKEKKSRFLKILFFIPSLCKKVFTFCIKFFILFKILFKLIRSYNKKNKP